MSKYTSDPEVVWKHEIELDDIIEVELPISAEVLLFSKQGSSFYLWEKHKVRHNNDRMPSTLIILGTGHQSPDEWQLGKHLGTIQDSFFVWHLFEVYDQRGNMS